MRFHIVSPGRNTEAFAEKHLASTRIQNFSEPYAITWVDDASDKISFARTGPDDISFTAVLRAHRQGGLKNILDVVRAMDPEDVAVLVSADDYLAHPNVLTRVKQEYDAGASLTYGQFVMVDEDGTQTPGWCRQLTKEEHDNPYDAPWVTTHLMTFRAGLMQEIPDEMLRDDDGEYFQVCGDQAFMLFMLALTPYEKCRFIPDVLLKYNRHPGNDDAGLAAAAEKRIRDRGRKWCAGFEGT